VRGPVARGRGPWWRPWVVAAFWLGVWQAAATALGHPILLVGPWDVAVRLVELVPTGAFWAAIGHTLLRIAVGFAAAALVGSLLAAASAAWAWVDALLAPVIAAIRATPVVSFIILVLIWANSSVLAAIVSFLMALPIMHATVLEGIRHRDVRLLEMVDVFDVPWARRVLAVDVPAVLPFFVAGCRTGIGLAWKSGIAAEVIGLPTGSIGEQLYQAKLFLATADLFAWTVVVVALSSLMERLVVWALERAQARLSGPTTSPDPTPGPGPTTVASAVPPGNGGGA
jgi:NitT/TauT family transport system permease protein